MRANGTGVLYVEFTADPTTNQHVTSATYQQIVQALDNGAHVVLEATVKNMPAGSYMYIPITARDNTMVQFVFGGNIVAFNNDGTIGVELEG